MYKPPFEFRFDLLTCRNYLGQFTLEGFDPTNTYRVVISQHRRRNGPIKVFFHSLADKSILHSRILTRDEQNEFRLRTP